MAASVIIIVKNYFTDANKTLKLREGEKHTLEKIRQFIFIFNKYNYDSKSHNYIQTEHIKFKL